MTRQRVFIPFRDRGLDPRRGANLAVVHAWWYAHGFEPTVVSDGGSGDEQFNRHRAYNRAVEEFPETEVFVFTEADMLIHPSQIREGLQQAESKPGLVVPFTTYRYLSDETTETVRVTYDEGDVAEWWALPPTDVRSIFGLHPESVMEDGKSIGAVNIVSRRTLEITGGFTEATSGNWYDDNIIEEGFAFLTGQRTRWVEGPAVHLYHLPGWTGAHLTDADKAATRRNRDLLVRMRADARMGNKPAVRALMEVRG